MEKINTIKEEKNEEILKAHFEAKRLKELHEYIENIKIPLGMTVSSSRFPYTEWLDKKTLKNEVLEKCFFEAFQNFKNTMLKATWEEMERNIKKAI
jgi:hypothetical protein